jgi:hypothetical protein
VVGDLIETSIPVDLARRSEWDGRPMELYRAKVNIQHVLQGDLDHKQVDIYYFADMGVIDSSDLPILQLNKGQTKIFFLMREAGRLRTICDGWGSCIFTVQTGMHYNFHPAPADPIEDVIMKVFLSRGDHTSDEQLMRAIEHAELRWGDDAIINALKVLVDRDPSPKVRALANEEIKGFMMLKNPFARKPRRCC